MQGETEQQDASRGKTQAIFLGGLVLAASGVITPPLALLGGIAFGFSTEHPLRAESHALAKILLQASVVALGFGMNLHEVIHAGRSGFLYTAIGIAVAIAFGLSLGALLRVKGRSSFLITAGTAICGGSAIAAISPINGANEEEIGVAMGTVFVLNSLALLVFPPIGAHFHLTQNQFGLWAALAIHDTSSVVGAAARYGAQALAIGTTVKLARALWIIPVSLLTALYMARLAAAAGKREAAGRVPIPWFIFLFCLAAAAPAYLPQFAPLYHALYGLGRSGLSATLFLIGTSLSLRTLRQVGVLPLVQGVTLWIAIASVSLFAICRGFISI